MHDPWLKTRERLDKYPWKDWTSAQVEPLLEDLDALSAANTVLRKALHEIAHGKHSGRGYANQILAETALPEHLNITKA